MALADIQSVLAKPCKTGYKLQACRASKDDFECYVESERQLLISRAMECFVDGIYIVELPRGVHEEITRGIDSLVILATGASEAHRVTHGSTYDDTTGFLEAHRLPNLKPDCSFGRDPDIGSFHALKIEVGVSRDLTTDHKLYAFPGIEYVLCVYMSSILGDIGTEPFSTVGHVLQCPPPENVAPIAIPAAMDVELDAGRLLVLSPNVPRPGGH
ncbi:hypothetical protein ACHHYP_05238 [Achlya hypogyna]|uniref:Restriction endonuclease domain-containing protein n=1 Tax=Achlya hypogyna TaxID=1202772 RepID=A0A1V9YYL5_ACHHY|nr:hypothetical protein ACHHYP_05238 [Achlya hypogyna]